MATRTPVYFDGTDIKDMDATQLDKIKAYARYLYASDPSVNLSYVSSGGSLGTINDTRNQSGTTLTSATSYLDAVLGTQVSVGNARVTQTTNSVALAVDSDNIKFPLYRDASNDLVSMTATDFVDTFCIPAMTSMATTDTTSSTDFGGLYHVQSSTTYAGSTLVSGSSIFTDTVNIGTTTGTSISPTDNPTTNQEYYLFRKDQQTQPTDYDLPLHVYDSTGDLTPTDSAEFNDVLLRMIKYTAVSGVGGRINYVWNSGTQRGTSITDTNLSGSTQTNQFFSAEDYRSQEHPSGSPVTFQTHYLGITIT